MWLNYFKDSEETVSGVCGILSTGSLPSLFRLGAHRVGRRSGGITPGKLLKSAALQSPSNNCHAAAAVVKNATRRRVSRIILASVVNASSRQRRGLHISIKVGMFEFQYCNIKWQEIHQAAPLWVIKRANSHIIDVFRTCANNHL